MLHHERSFIASIEAEHRAAAQRRRPPADPGELERTMLASARRSAGLNALFERFGARIRAVARAHRLSTQDADDVVQTTWLRLIEHGGSVREPAAIGAWLDTTARRESLRVLRGAKRERPTEHELLAEDACEGEAEREAILAEERAALAASMARLPAQQRRLLQMLLADPPLPYAEIARALDMPMGSIGPTRARLIARMRRDGELTRVLAPND